MFAAAGFATEKTLSLQKPGKRLPKSAIWLQYNIEDAFSTQLGKLREDCAENRGHSPESPLGMCQRNSDNR